MALIKWGSEKIIIGMKVYLSESNKRMYFYFPEKQNIELGPYEIVGSSFRVFAGHCNAGKGEIRILSCKSMNIENDAIKISDIVWSSVLSKSGACTVDSNKKNITINGESCYTYFVTDLNLSDINFKIEFEVNVAKSDKFLYIGVYNSSNYTLKNTCSCCNPLNSYFVQCDGSFHTNGTRTENTNFKWASQQKTIIGMKVYLKDNANMIFFYLPEKEGLEAGPYSLNPFGVFKVFAGSCNKANGTIKILNASLIK